MSKAKRLRQKVNRGRFVWKDIYPYMHFSKMLRKHTELHDRMLGYRSIRGKL